MTKLTRAQVEKTIKCGDGIGVVYRNANGAAKILRLVEGGRASHWIECLGGLETVEETIGGGMKTDLFTYLKGNCDLVVRRVRGGLDKREQAYVRTYWLGLVGGGYGWDSIKRSMVTVPVRRFVKPLFPRLASAIVAMARFLLPGKMPDCSAAWVDGMRLVRKNIMVGYEPEEVDPYDLWKDPDLVTVAHWKCPVLEDE